MSLCPHRWTTSRRRARSTDDRSMATALWSPSPAVCPSGPTALPTLVVLPRTAPQLRSPIGTAICTYQPTRAGAGRARPTAFRLRAASSSPERQRKVWPSRPSRTNLDLFGEDSWRNVYAGELEVHVEGPLHVAARACGFYGRHVCSLRAIHHVADLDLPDE